jgi:hypothetical protein
MAGNDLASLLSYTCDLVVIVLGPRYSLAGSMLRVAWIERAGSPLQQSLEGNMPSSRRTTTKTREAHGNLMATTP